MFAIVDGSPRLIVVWRWFGWKPDDLFFLIRDIVIRRVVGNVGVHEKCCVCFPGHMDGVLALVDFDTRLTVV